MAISTLTRKEASLSVRSYIQQWYPHLPLSIIQSPNPTTYTSADVDGAGTESSQHNII
jgi:hypothetical protein